jgi:hypothetical protein
MCEGDACHGCRNYSDRTDSISSVGNYPTLRFGTGPVKGYRPKVSTESKIDQEVTPRRAERFPTNRTTRAESMATSRAKGPASIIVVVVVMPPRPPSLSMIQTMTKAISADDTTISFQDRAPHNSLRVDRLRVVTRTRHVPITWR